MKKLLFALLFCPIIMLAQNNHHNLDINIKFKSIAADTFYITVSAMIPKNMERIGYPDTIIVQPAKTHSLQLIAGIYTIGIFGKRIVPLRQNIVVESLKTKIVMDVSLQAQGLPSKINSIKMIGDFNAWNVAKAVKLVKHEGRWVLKDSVVIPQGSSYSFSINDQLQLHSLAIPSTFNVEWGHFDHTFNEENILFDQSLYAKELKASSCKITGFTENPKLSDMLKLVADVNNKLNEAEMDSLMTSEQKDLFYKNLKEKLADVKRSNPEFKQLFITPQLKVEQLNSAFRKYLKLYQQQADSMALVNVLNTPVFNEYLIAMANAMKEADGKSPYLDKMFIDETMNLMFVLGKNPEIGSPMNVTPKSYYQFVMKYLDTRTRKRDIVNVLISLSYYYKECNNRVYLTKCVDKLKNEYPDDHFVKEGYAQILIESLDFKEGLMAPDFKVKLINGDSLQLSDLKGKYVFIDIWGTWCGPCRAELPNVTKLSQEISTDQLKVIGLASDDEEKLKDFVVKKDLPYSNAVASKEILNDYKILSFPTTFLIGPDGRIKAVNLRGSNLTELVKSKMGILLKNGW